MNTNEKILLVQLLLEDIRDESGYSKCGRSAEDRASKANSLCKEIANESNNDEYLILADFCDTYIKTSKKWGDWDGRFFRQPFPMGYEKMEKLHHMKPTIKNRSDEFKFISKEYLTNPEFRFTDWESFVGTN